MKALVTTREIQMVIASAVHSTAAIWVDPAAIVSAAVAAGGVLFAIWRRIIRPVLLMTKDWNGEPGRPGVARRAGIMERLDNHDSLLEVIHQEVNLNHGGSIKDAVHRIESDVNTMKMRMDARGY